ncbi:glycosyl hydrolase family 18 protein [Patescibacteria group bacterium]|nr:glycosyl hydrolase family 18 protein [Patescibacteria group bacterium]
MKSFFILVFGFIVSIVIIIVGLYLFVRLTPPSSSSLATKVLGIYKPEIIGFHPFWLVGAGKDSYAKDITTLAYFSLAVEKDGTIRKEDNPGEGEPGFVMLTSDTYAATLSAHRKAGTKLSLLVQNMVEEDILALIATPEAHATKLVEEVAPIMQKHGFTDLNLDIESFTKASESARLGYVQFVKAVKDELTRLHLGTLTVELTPKSPVELHLIDVARIGEIADYLVLMAYDYHYIFSFVAGPIAPLGGVPTTAEYDVETALKETLRFAPASKVILGVPLYGYEWETLKNIPGSAVIPGSWQLATGKRMEEFTKTCADCTKGFDAVAQEPYVIFPGETPRHFQQAFYENKDALQAKIALAKKYQLAGVAMWAVGYESDGMLAPIDVYKNSVQYSGFGLKPAIPYTQIQPASLTLSPPTHALVGSIATMSGEVKKMGRQDEEYHVLESVGPIVQGESVATEADGNMVIQFSNAITMEAGPWSELSFSELLPPNIAIRQKGGTVTYRLINKDTPWSIRVLQTLVVFEEGEMEVSIEGTRATVLQKAGRTVLGNIDADNNTTTYDLLEGQTAQLNESTQTVSIK